MKNDELLNEVITCFLKQYGNLQELIDLAVDYGFTLTDKTDINSVVDDTMRFFSEHREERGSFPWAYGCDFVRVCNECHSWMCEGYYAEGCIVDGIWMDGYWCSDECLNKKITNEQWEFLSSSARTHDEFNDPDFEDEGNDYAYNSEWCDDHKRKVTLTDGRVFDLCLMHVES